jgi:hypothetical protein
VSKGREDSLLERVTAAAEERQLSQNTLTANREGRVRGRIRFLSGSSRPQSASPYQNDRRMLALETLLALRSVAGCINFKRVRAVRSNAARPGMQRMPGPASLQELTMASISDYAAAISHLL